MLKSLLSSLLSIGKQSSSTRAKHRCHPSNCQHDFISLGTVSKISDGRKYGVVYVKGCTHCKSIRLHDPVERKSIAASTVGLSIDIIRNLQNSIPDR